MSGRSKIEWTDATWNPIRARLIGDELIQLSDGTAKTIPAGTWGYHCERVSPGCLNCYACAMNGRTLRKWGTGLDYTVPNRAKVKIYLDDKELDKPLHWRRPRKVFVCSMTDLFADFVSDRMIDRVFLRIAACFAAGSGHEFQILTKRADRMARHTYQFGSNGTLPNAIMGVSVENQCFADNRREYLERIAAKGWRTFVSYEPALGPVNWKGWEFLDWMIVGGESGIRARPFEVDWAREAIAWCKAQKVPCFVKQLGADPLWPRKTILFPPRRRTMKLKDRKGGKMEEWPDYLRVRQGV